MGEENETKRAVKAAMAQHSKIVVGDDKKRQTRCMDEVKGILAKYDCALVPRMMMQPGAPAEFMIECKAIPRDAQGKAHGQAENTYAVQGEAEETEEPTLLHEKETEAASTA